MLMDGDQHGPRDLDKHSKWPIFMRLHGSVMPKLFLPLVIVALWSTLITCISRFIQNRELLGVGYRDGNNGIADSV